MRDFTSSNYCNILWINDVLALKKKNSNQEYVAEAKKEGKKYMIAIKFVAIFGNIIEIKHIPNKGYLYSVDDGTGVILCNYNNKQFEEVVETMEKESDQFFSETFEILNDNSRSINESTRNDDTIFNDKTYQSDELRIMKKNQKAALQSLWTDVLQSYQSLVNKFDIGDTVYVQGKLYTYFEKNQIYVNTIRLMDTTEEIIQVTIKLEDGFDPLVPVTSDPEMEPEFKMDPEVEQEVKRDPDVEQEIKRNPKRKFSDMEET